MFNDVTSNPKSLRTHLRDEGTNRPDGTIAMALRDLSSFMAKALGEENGGALRATPDFLSRLVASRTACGFLTEKPHTLPSLAPRTGNLGTLS
jgi:hypothetical protein